MRRTVNSEEKGPIKLGNVYLQNRVIAAPMAGVTDKAFRIILKLFGCGMVYTEMISDRALLYGQGKTLFMCDVDGEEPPVAVQIFGKDPDTMAAAARMVGEKGAGLVDINMGCPTPKIVKNGEGAALMKNPDLAVRVVEAVVEASLVPVTVKMRAGWDAEHINCCELAEAVTRVGARAVAIHPRTREQFYSGRADWELIRQVKKRVLVPVIGNGDISSAADAAEMLERTGCDLVMIGRGSLGNPFIFRETLHYLETGEHLAPATPGERLEVARYHLELACRLKGARGVVEMRKHLAWYTKGLPGASRARVLLNQAQTREQMEEVLNKLMAQC